MVKNKKAQLSVNIFVLGTLIVCIVSLSSFLINSNKIKFNFYSISALEDENIKIERMKYDEFSKLSLTDKETQCLSNDICECQVVDSKYNTFLINEKNVNSLITENSLCSDKDFFKNLLFEFMKSLSDNNVIYVGSQCKCKDNCQKYAMSLVEKGCENNIDPYLLLSIMMQESQCVASATNKNSETSLDCGLMQINVNNIEDCNNLKNDFDLSIQKSINILKSKKEDDCIFTGGKYDGVKIYCDGSNLLMNSGCKRKIKYSGWAAKIRGYNGWGAGGEPYYTELVLERYLELKQLKEKMNVEQVKSSSNKITVDYDYESNILLDNP